jgi:hypothetical protein
MGDSKGSCGVNPKYLATALPGGISFEISPFGNQHHRVIGRIYLNALSNLIPNFSQFSPLDYFRHFSSL